MTVLVACDDNCYSFDGHYYLRFFGHTLVERYLTTFDKVLFAVRTKQVCSKDELGIYNIPIDNERVTIVPVPFFQGPKQLSKVVCSVYKIARKTVCKCDLAILRLPSPTAFIFWETIKKKGIAYACEIVANPHDLYSNARFPHSLYWKIMHKMQVKACNDAMGVSCVTAKHLQQWYYPNTPSAVVSHYSSADITSDFYYKDRCFPLAKDFSIIHIAHHVFLNSGKGHSQLLRVLRELISQGYNPTLVFVGEDYFGGISQVKSYAEELGIRNRIRFTGFLSKDDLRKEMISADIMVFPSMSEGLPRVVIEAMALGLPCIATSVGGIPELISNDMLVNYDDINEMAHKITHLMNDKDYYEMISHDNFERSKEYNSDVLNERRTDFYKQLKTRIDNPGNTSLISKASKMYRGNVNNTPTSNGGGVQP